MKNFTYLGRYQQVSGPTPARPHQLVPSRGERAMKTMQDANQKRRPYVAPVVKRQSNLKLISLLPHLSPDTKRTASTSR